MALRLAEPVASAASDRALEPPSAAPGTLDERLLALAIDAVASPAAQAVLERACATLAEVLGAERVAIAEHDAGRDALVEIAASDGAHEVACGDDGLERDATRPPRAALLTTPIHLRGHRFGVIEVHGEHGLELGPEAGRALTTVARLVAAALDRERAATALPRSAQLFVSRLAHQVRQPLHTIGLEVELLRNDPSDGRLRLAIDRIETETFRCDRLLRRALHLAGDPGGFDALADGVAPHTPT